MKILVLGSDGYLGFALTQYLRDRGHEVEGFDNLLRRKIVNEVGSDSLVPIQTVEGRKIRVGDLKNMIALKIILTRFRPDAIVHFAEQPSAPYSMRGWREAFLTQENNILGTLNLLWAMRVVCPEAHLVKLGTMGVYGTPEGDIPETNAAIAYDPASFYHNSKAADSINIRKSCIWWGLRATDLHQGVVYGHIEGTRLDYDSYFGTVVNRFMAQATVGHPLTVYGAGGQTRGFININDTMRCIELSILNPPEGYRVFNQITETFSVEEIARMVATLTGAEIEPITNPRIEKEAHYYNPKHVGLLELGLEPRKMIGELPYLWETVKKNRSRIREEVIQPKTSWK